MKSPRFDYEAPETVEAALALLAGHGDRARVLAGGQSLLPSLHYRLAAPGLLVDLGRIAALASGAPRARADGAFIFGAMTPHATFEESEPVRERLPLLHHAVRYIAHPQIRNRGTVGGSACHADPAAEWPALCLACDARLIAARPGGRRAIPAAAFFLGPFTTALAPGELLVEVEFPAWPPGRRWGFRELARRRGDFAIAGAACTLDLDDAGRCRAGRVAVFGAGEGTGLVPAALEPLLAEVPDARRVREAARAARASVPAHSDQHASAGFRSELVETLVSRALAAAAGLPERALDD
ncbi:MAG: xanthine dehydrogenase family protein subunit M [Burkholderiales bacterium]|nr:xanthine dehydrogenase family protein subunit M [Burkholderiales bacterium]